MLQLRSFTFNPFSENTYLIHNEENECWIVDPGMCDEQETKHLFSYIEQQQLQPKAIINTHAHIDHILGVQAVVDKFKIPFHLHQKDEIVLNNAMASAIMFGLPFKGVPPVTSYIDENTSLMLGKDEVVVRLAPGHSPGSVIFYYAPGNWAIGGDVLFYNSIGRTDLPGGNHETLLDSIRTQLFTLPENTVVHPGHGPSTTIGYEKATNPFLN